MITLILITAALFASGSFCLRMVFWAYKQQQFIMIAIFAVSGLCQLGAAIALTVKLFQDYT